MERVKKGERYWYVVNDCDGVEVEYAYDDYTHTDKALFELGNYFTDRESAEAVARKIRAVLKGADVIEMPSEEEIKNKASEMCCIGGCDHSCEDSHFCGLAFPRERSIKMAEWLKSKIIK